MADEPQRFRVIPGGPAGDGEAKPKAYRARKRGEPEVLTCSECEKDTGVATALSFEMKQGRMIRDGVPFGGSKVIYCGHCLARGKLTKLI
ncbi:hypothetical protein [Rhizobium phaseoli]|uniref:Uncharacterized protein n=1 Tax=Rhizobium phaseoli TaxID=396 RepID=A0ABM6C8W8_9HYPH|nr:hypothetical protein [Rhizobium phaseoli]ANL84665.1 hypothetical protein AMC81_CH01884 [Rhizobium phaseoli]ANL91172.1 hypothetical protein AMC80_CH01884 [Rhizobium phaseoli]